MMPLGKISLDRWGRTKIDGFALLRSVIKCPGDATGKFVTHPHKISFSTKNNNNHHGITFDFNSGMTTIRRHFGLD